MALHDQPLKRYRDWFDQRAWKPFDFQEETLHAYMEGYSGILNAPTGSGKTYALWLPVLMEHLQQQDADPNGAKGLKVLWITPVRALAKDILNAMQRAASELGIPWYIVARTGDTSAAERQKHKRNIPDAMITTPESLHVMLAQKGYPEIFTSLRAVIVDEWHELLGTKRGVQVELALSRMKAMRPGLKIWGISATIGNLDQAMYVLLGEHIHDSKFRLVKADIEKDIAVETLLPDEIERFPWGGHLGVKLLPKMLPIIDSSRTSLVFTNTRSQCEIWYQRLLDAEPDLAGQIGLHHGSLSAEVRNWVENALHEEALKVVVCTSSLDLGVDIRPVETVFQVGGPKGVARFLQRAGRSGHEPGATSRIYFVPTNSLELIEGAAIREALKEGRVESRIPVVRAFDVLIQYLVTLAVSEGFVARQLFDEVVQTHAYNSISEDEWRSVLEFVTSGGASLRQYPEFHKVVVEEGIYKVVDRRIAMRHRMSIGTIVSDASMTVKFMKGGTLGTIEEGFISRLKPGDVFSYAGRNLELVQIREMQAIVRIAKSNKSIVPQWFGGKMPLSSQLSDMIRRKLTEAMEGTATDVELKVLQPLFATQRERSIIPREDQFLVESLFTKEGHHVFFYTFEGRYVNEGLAALFSHRFARVRPVTFSIAMSDYGIEMLCDQEIDIQLAIDRGLFSTENLTADILGGMNAMEMARRKFRDIAHIAGLIFQGYPGKHKKNKDLQASSRLFFEVFRDYEPENLLLRQAFDEVLYDQLDETRLRAALQRISTQEIVIKKIDHLTPFSFPIYVEMFREKASTESFTDRVQRMIKQLERS
jgi:ATP-dependent helicase Lhr and Lhr-like helicase